MTEQLWTIGGLGTGLIAVLAWLVLGEKRAIERLRRASPRAAVAAPQTDLCDVEKEPAAADMHPGHRKPVSGYAWEGSWEVLNPGMHWPRRSTDESLNDQAAQKIIR